MRLPLTLLLALAGVSIAATINGTQLPTSSEPTTTVPATTTSVPPTTATTLLVEATTAAPTQTNYIVNGTYFPVTVASPPSLSSSTLSIQPWAVAVIVIGGIVFFGLVGLAAKRAKNRKGNPAQLEKQAAKEEREFQKRLARLSNI